MKTILKTTLLLFVINVSVLQAQTDDALKINDNGNVGINTSNPTEKLEVNGNTKVNGNVTADSNVNANGKIQQNGNDLLPKGAIIMWYGGTTAPAGWAICNGENGTPDLQDKFIIGAGKTRSAYKDYGSKNNKISIENLPQHDHDIEFKDEAEKNEEVKYAKLMPWKTYQAKFKDGDKSAFDGGGYNEKQIDFSVYIKNLKTNKGNKIPNENNQNEFIPKSYALYYIIKL